MLKRNRFCFSLRGSKKTENGESPNGPSRKLVPEQLPGMLKGTTLQQKRRSTALKRRSHVHSIMQGLQPGVPNFLPPVSLAQNKSQTQNVTSFRWVLWIPRREQRFIFANLGTPINGIRLLPIGGHSLQSFEKRFLAFRQRNTGRNAAKNEITSIPSDPTAAAPIDLKHGERTLELSELVPRIRLRLSCVGLDSTDIH